MNSSSTSHSFRRLLETSEQKYEHYVLSESRYTGLIRLLEAHLDQNQFQNVVDIGCGAGVISRGLAGKFKYVTGIDGNPDNITLATTLTTDTPYSNISYKHGFASELPVETKSVDLAVLNGVLEWVGANDRGEDPKLLQLQVLKETFRVLKPNGILYLAIENRWHPRTVMRDPHTHLPWVNALPRSLANIVSKRISGKPFQAYIHGLGKIQKMLLISGFHKIESFAPFPGYHYPEFYIPIYPREASLLAISAIDVAKVKAINEDAARIMDVDKAVLRMRRRAKWGLLGLLAHDFSFLARKNNDRYTV